MTTKGIERMLVGAGIVLATCALGAAATGRAWAGDYRPTPDEARDYEKPCEPCPTCPPCPEPAAPAEDPTRLRLDLKSGVLMGVGDTTDRIDFGPMVEPTLGVRLLDGLSLEAGYLWSNNGVSNPGARSGSQNLHCFRSGPRVDGDVGGLGLYGAFKMGYCRADGRGTGFADHNFVAGPGAGVVVPIVDHLDLTAGTDLLWFTGGGRDNQVITPNASIRLGF
jgi:hypothetical protein